MAHPYHHSLSSVKKWGGEVSDYLPLHTWFDQSKAIAADFRHRALRHHAEGIFMLVIWTGKPVSMFASTEVVVPVVQRRGPVVRVARIDAQAERTAGRCLVDPPGRARGSVSVWISPVVESRPLAVRPRSTPLCPMTALYTFITIPILSQFLP